MKNMMPIEIQSSKATLRGTTYIVNSVYSGTKNIAQRLGNIMINDFQSELADEYFSENLFENNDRYIETVVI